MYSVGYINKHINLSLWHLVISPARKMSETAAPQPQHNVFVSLFGFRDNLEQEDSQASQ